MTGTKWLFFDMGHTLIDEDAVWADRCQRLSARLNTQGRDVSAEEIHALTARYAAEFRKLVEDVNHFYGAGDELFCDPADGTPYPGAAGLLAALAKHYRLGVVANQAAGTEERLRNWGLRKYFEIVCSSAELGVSKPDPRIFEIALGEAHAAPESCFMIGDRLDNDIAPAKKLGMGTVWIRQGFGLYQTAPSPEYEPDYTAESFAEAAKLFL
ncbi:MAG TPA: HAD family hydrolase [Oscillospiraceae bacterium]|nr:HAD family hydrolase [Oscillospiraceae bacterium]